MATRITKAQRAKVVAYARAQKGKKYLWLGTGIGKTGYDCSGLVLMSWLQAGFVLPHNSGAQAIALHAVPYSTANKAKLLHGDVIFYYGSVKTPASITHCAVYTGIDPVTKLREVVAAVDDAHGVMEHDIAWALTPSGFGYVGHS